MAPSEVLPTMIQNFRPEKADGVDATIQINLTGDNAAQYWIKIANNQVEYGEGAADSAAMTMHGSAEDFVKIVNGEMNPMQAFMVGKLKVSGDMGLAMKMMPMFGMG